MRAMRFAIPAAFLLASIVVSTTRAATVAPPDATIEGRTLSEWSAEWWKSVAATGCPRLLT